MERNSTVGKCRAEYQGWTIWSARVGTQGEYMGHATDVSDIRSLSTGRFSGSGAKQRAFDRAFEMVQKLLNPGS
jgi:hypothetical protein